MARIFPSRAAQCLQAWRHARSMNLDAAAAALKLGRMTLWRTENGRYENDVPIRPSQATMDALVRAGVCTAADFFEPADPDEPGAGEAAAA